MHIFRLRKILNVQNHSFHKIFCEHFIKLSKTYLKTKSHHYDSLHPTHKLRTGQICLPLLSPEPTLNCPLPLATWDCGSLLPSSLHRVLPPHPVGGHPGPTGGSDSHPDFQGDRQVPGGGHCGFGCCVTNRFSQGHGGILGVILVVCMCSLFPGLGRVW